MVPSTGSLMVAVPSASPSAERWLRCWLTPTFGIGRIIKPRTGPVATGGGAAAVTVRGTVSEVSP